MDAGEEEEDFVDPFSPSAMYVKGSKLYGSNETGLEKWKNDLLRFVSEDFHNSLNSDDADVCRKANQEISLWMSTTNLSFFFRGSWGSDQNNKMKAMQYLNKAQLLEEKYNDQPVIEIIDRAIESCFENKNEFDSYWSE